MNNIRSTAGFSLTELMVVFVIIGILATMAIPRFREFVATSRQGEAKLNLGQISKLQHLYMTAKEKYLAMGVAPTGHKQTGAAGIGLVTNAAGEKQASSCNTATMRKLGFKASGCEDWRYSYWVLTTNTGGVDRFVVGAFSPSTPSARIFPTCDGSTQEGGATTLTRQPLTLDHSLTTAIAGSTMTITAKNQGDTWMIDDQRKMQSDSLIPVCKGEGRKGENMGVVPP